MVQIYTSSVESSNDHAVLFSEASALNLEIAVLEHWMYQQLGEEDSQDAGDPLNMRSFGESLSETIFVNIMVINGNGEREREREIF